MSIASALSDIASALSDILSACNTKLTAKGVSGTAETLSEVPDKINAIVTGTGLDTSDATAAAGDIASGKTAYVNGSKITGNVVTKSGSDVTASGETVTVPAGLYGSQVQKSVATAQAATPTISVHTSTGVITAQTTQQAGYVQAATKTQTHALPTQSGTTITPGVGAVAIPAGRYLTGNILINGSASLVPENIRAGATIFNVAGTYAGGGDLDINYGSYNATTWGSVSYNTLTITVSNSTYSGVVKGAHIYMKNLPNGMSGGTIMSMIILPEGANKFQADIGVLWGGTTVHNSGTVLSVSKGASETTITITAGMYISSLSDYAEFATGGDYYVVTLITG